MPFTVTPLSSACIPPNIVSAVTAVSAWKGVGAGLTAFILALWKTPSWSVTSTV